MVGIPRRSRTGPDGDDYDIGVVMEGSARLRPRAEEPGTSAPALAGSTTEATSAPPTTSAPSTTTTMTTTTAPLVGRCPSPPGQHATCKHLGGGDARAWGSGGKVRANRCRNPQDSHSNGVFFLGTRRGVSSWKSCRRSTGASRKNGQGVRSAGPC